MTIKFDGKIVSKPQITTLSDKAASIESVSKEGQGTFIEVTPVLNSNNTVEMNIAIGEIENEKRIILVNPELITRVGQKTVVTQELSTGKKYNNFSLEVMTTL